MLVGRGPLVHNTASHVISCELTLWQDRAYESFVTQSPVDFIEFSDAPLDSIPKDELYHGHFPARYITQYLEQYIDNHIYNGKTLRSRIQFNTGVERLTKNGELWHAVTANGNEFTAPKVIDAVGLTSQPSVPNISGSKSFRGVQIHHKDFGGSDLLSTPDIHSIAVLGGAKSAADVAYQAAKAGKTVHWIIRKSGSGPAWFVPSRSIGGLAKCSTHELWVRGAVPLFASIFAEPGSVSKFFYRSWLGQKIFWAIWAGVEALLSYLTDFERKDGQENGFYNLKPDTGPFWANDSTSLANKADFFDTVATHVHVYRQDVKCISENTLQLDNGTNITVDAIIYATGWTANLSYIDKQFALNLGCPMAEDDQDEKTFNHWHMLEQEADAVIAEQFPVLSQPPPHRQPDLKSTPLRLYKSVTPINDHSIAFVGKAIIAHAFPAAEVQALWAVAALDDKIPFLSIAEMEQEVARTTVWSRRRYLTRGYSAMWFPWDLIPYTDMLLKQLGLSCHRGTSWWKDMTTPSSSSKFRGLIDEYKEKYS